MRLRVILILSFMLVAGIPLVITLFYVKTHITEQYRAEKKEQLSALSLIARNRIEIANARVEDNLKLISSRTQLRQILSKWSTFNNDQRDRNTEKIQHILEDAQNSIPNIKGTYIYDLQKSLVVTTNAKLREPEILFGGGDQIQLHLKRIDDELIVVASDKLVLNGKVVGFMVIVYQGDYISKLIEDRSGLGKTGEWLFALRNENGDALFAVPLKYDVDAAFRRKVPKSRTDVPIIPALSGKEVFLENAPDYRNVPVMAFTRYLKKHGWGLVVKIDESEVMEPISNIENVLIILGLILILISAIVGIFLSHVVAYPVENLQKVTNKIKKGDLDSRADEKGWNEIKHLSMSFNSMAKTMKDLTENLQLKVKDRTARLDEANKRLEQLATKDPLTNTYNRRYFLERLQQEFSRVSRYKGRLAVFMFDIDNFKSINDTYGHQVGDEILKLFSSCLLKMLRNTDIFGRIGGEEFCAIILESSDDSLEKLSNRMREEISKLLYPLDKDKTIQITTSVGVSIYKDGVDSPEVLMERADNALYEAKKRGRNRVIFYNQNIIKLRNKPPSHSTY